MEHSIVGSNITWTSRALCAALVLLPLWLSGCADDKKTDSPPTNTFDLTVSLTGSGQVTSSPAGIDCGSDCTELLDAGTTVTLTATPASGYMFSGWGGDCSGTATPCVLIMDVNRSVTGTFVLSTNVTPAPTVTLSAEPTTLANGGTSLLTWSSTNTTLCTASGGWSGPKELNGNESTGALTANQTYVLTCTGAGGSANQSVTITIAGLPPPTGGEMPTGIPAIGAWYDATPVTVSAISSGTVTAPTLYSRAGMPEIVGNYSIACSYCIVDGAKVKGNVSLTGDHIVFRNSEVYGYNPGGNGTVVMASGNNIVIRGNHIHDNGNMDLAVEHDVHGVSAGNGTKNVWVLENELNYNSGDGVQVGHGHTPGATDGIYVGRNLCYSNKENCVDFKIVSNTVVSENVMHSYPGGDAGGGGGVAVVLHYCNHNSHVLNNTITASNVGVSIASKLSNCTGPIKAYIKGNTIDGMKGNAIQMWDGSNEPHIENNIIKNAPVGIDLTNCPAATTVIGNAFTNVPAPTVYAGAGCNPITSY